MYLLSQSTTINNAWLKVPIFPTPNLPLVIRKQTQSHWTKWYSNSFPKPPHKYSLYNLSTPFATQVGMVNKYIDKLESVLFKRVILSPHNQLPIFSKILFHTIFALKGFKFISFTHLFLTKMTTNKTIKYITTTTLIIVQFKKAGHTNINQN